MTASAAALSVTDLVAFEREVAGLFNAGKIRAPVHLSGGNEEWLIQYFATKVHKNNWVCSTWRSHYHCLLRGVPPDQLLADIKAGKSIALNYPEHRIVSSAIVGGALPIALGLALSIKRNGYANTVHVFVGDMAERTGIFHECIQYASGHDLPLRFVVERNGISVCTDVFETWGTKRWTAGRVEGYSYRLPWPHSGAGKRVEF